MGSRQPPLAASALLWQRRPVMTLDQLPLGQSARIVAVDRARLVPEEALRLAALGLDAGATVSIAHRGVFGSHDPIALAVGRMTVAVRRAHARAITVEAL